MSTSSNLLGYIYIYIYIGLGLSLDGIPISLV